MTGLHTNPSSSRESLSLSCPVPLGRKAVQGINLDGMGFSGHLVHQGIVGPTFFTLLKCWLGLYFCTLKRHGIETLLLICYQPNILPLSIYCSEGHSSLRLSWNLRIATWMPPFLRILYPKSPWHALLPLEFSPLLKTSSQQFPLPVSLLFSFLVVEIIYWRSFFYNCMWTSCFSAWC